MPSTTAEAVIIGGGVMGCSIAWHLAAKGMTDVVLLERDVLGSGSTGRSTATVDSHHSSETLVRMASHSLQVFRSFKDAVGGECGFTETGHLVFAGIDDYARTSATVALQRKAGVKARMITRQEVANNFPGLHLDDCAAISYEPAAGHADASGTALSYATRARRSGVKTLLRSPATGLEFAGGRVTAVVTENGPISSGRVIVAAGPWCRGFLSPYGIDLPLTVTRHQVAAFRVPDTSPPIPAGAHDLINQIYLRPEGSGLVLAGDEGAEEFSELADPEMYAHRPTPGFIGSVWTRLARRIPEMAQAEYATGFAGLYTSTPDRLPIMGQVNGIDGLYVCGGFSGHGFKLAPAVGLVMAEMAIDGRASSFDVSPLSLSRFDYPKN